MVKITNTFIEKLVDKYDRKDLEDWFTPFDRRIIDISVLSKIIGVIKYEMIRIRILCCIDELKDVFHNIVSKKNIISSNGIRLNVCSYVNTSNSDSIFMAKLFGDSCLYEYVVEIYRDGFMCFDEYDIDLSCLGFL
jgi:hypothetical protein